MTFINLFLDIGDISFVSDNAKAHCNEQQQSSSRSTTWDDSDFEPPVYSHKKASRRNSCDSAHRSVSRLPRVKKQKGRSRSLDHCQPTLLQGDDRWSHNEERKQGKVSRWDVLSAPKRVISSMRAPRRPSNDGAEKDKVLLDNTPQRKERQPSFNDKTLGSATTTEELAMLEYGVAEPDLNNDEDLPDERHSTPSILSTPSRCNTWQESVLEPVSGYKQSRRRSVTWDERCLQSNISTLKVYHSGNKSRIPSNDHNINTLSHSSERRRHKKKNRSTSLDHTAPIMRPQRIVDKSRSRSLDHTIPDRWACSDYTVDSSKNEQVSRWDVLSAPRRRISCVRAPRRPSNDREEDTNNNTIIVLDQTPMRRERKPSFNDKNDHITKTRELLGYEDAEP